MQFRIRHELRCRFGSPLRNIVAVLRLCPRSHEGQHVTDWWIDADIDCNLKSGDDEFGNLTHTFSAGGPFGEIAITAAGTIDTFDTAGIVRSTAERLPVEIFLRDTLMTTCDAALRDFVRSRTATEATGLGRLHALMEAVHGEIAHQSGGASLSAAEALSGRTGGHGTHAHIFIAGARLLGTPCRFVSGYLIRSDTGEGTCHAWAEAFVPDLGWVGFDPVNNLCPQGEHVRGAIGFDAVNASFVRGTPPETTSHTLKVTALS